MLVAEIEDRPDNTTRFLVVGRKAFQPSGKDKTTLLVSAAHTDSPGALYRLLEPLAKAAINVTRIESRPSQRRKWDYVFFWMSRGTPRIASWPKRCTQLKRRALAVSSSGFLSAGSAVANEDGFDSRSRGAAGARLATVCAWQADCRAGARIRCARHRQLCLQ